VRQSFDERNFPRAFRSKEAKNASSASEFDDIRADRDQSFDGLLERHHPLLVHEHLPVIVKRDELAELGLFIHPMNRGYLFGATGMNLRAPICECGFHRCDIQQMPGQWRRLNPAGQFDGKLRAFRREGASAG
jgi:hypothetical protein